MVLNKYMALQVFMKVIFNNDINLGTYYAAISLYMQAQCRINFGESPFKFPPPQMKQGPTWEKWRPYKEVVQIKSPTTKKI